MKRKIDIIALSILIATAVNCGLIGLFRFNVITWLFDGETVAASRIIYMLVAVAGLWSLNLIAVQAHRNHITSYGANGGSAKPAYANGENTASDFMNVGNTEPDPIYNRYRSPGPISNFDTASLKDNPADETVCSPYFSQGCINEDTDSSEISTEEDKSEIY